uniref:Uncharacterized protein n=1 Tax=Molossus molossus TaxID=27622 RepID=A0A7J8I923_MOLMO|nr:hypothetical protein HJG59_010532 [Molossus molossus]
MWRPKATLMTLSTAHMPSWARPCLQAQGQARPSWARPCLHVQRSDAACQGGPQLLLSAPQASVSSSAKWGKSQLSLHECGRMWKLRQGGVSGSQSSAGKGLFKARGSCLKPRLTNSCHLLGHCPRETAEPYHFRCSNSQRKKSQEKSI